MMKNRTGKFLVFLMVNAIMVFSGSYLAAQEINREVYVIRPYEPTLSDAAKYNFMPAMGDTSTIKPKLQYSINPTQLENSFEPEPIKAAKTVTTSLPKIYNSWIKLGLGNYFTPLAEFNISNLRSKDYAYGAQLYHKSSHGKIALPNDKKVNADYMVNKAGLYGKKFFPDMTLGGNLNFSQNAFRYYGYNSEIFTDPSVKLDRDSSTQSTYLVGIDIGAVSAYTDSAHLNYKANGSFNYFFDKFGYQETGFEIKTAFDKNFNGILGGLDVSLDYSHLNGSADTLSDAIFRLHPYISKRSQAWKFMLGFETAFDISEVTRFYFYPRANLDIIVYEDVLIPFVGISGELQKNSYQQVISENQFIKPGISLKNTSSNLIVYGGIKGSITSKVRFRADVSYTAMKRAHYFVNDTMNWQNQFEAVYDDNNLVTYHGQLVVQPVEKLEFLADARYFKYIMFEQLKPWHKPDFMIEFDTRYKITPKIIAEADICITGNRWTKNYSYPDDMAKLKPVADINFKLNYHYSKVLTLFADLYNLADRSYMIWNQYPSQRFNFLFGLSYKL
jgi:hypothetical protein